jgi:hypothetical protein
LGLQASEGVERRAPQARRSIGSEGAEQRVEQARAREQRLQRAQGAGGDDRVGISQRCDQRSHGVLITEHAEELRGGEAHVAARVACQQPVQVAQLCQPRALYGGLADVRVVVSQQRPCARLLRFRCPRRSARVPPVPRRGPRRSDRAARL